MRCYIIRDDKVEVLTQVPASVDAEVVLIQSIRDLDQKRFPLSRLLTIWNAQRSKRWPDVPTLQESGVALISNSPFGLAGPKGMDMGVVKILHDAFKKGMEEPSYVQTLAKIDQEPFYLNTADYRAFVVQTVAEQKQLMEQLGFKPE